MAMNIFFNHSFLCLIVPTTDLSAIKIFLGFIPSAFRIPSLFHHCGLRVMETLIFYDFPFLFPPSTFRYADCGRQKLLDSPYISFHFSPSAFRYVLSVAKTQNTMESFVHFPLFAFFFPQWTLGSEKTKLPYGQLFTFRFSSSAFCILREDSG